MVEVGPRVVCPPNRTLASERVTKAVTAPLDVRLSEKMRQDGLPKSALKAIAGKELSYDELMAYSLKYSDAVITCEPGVSDTVLEAAASLPKLEFIDDDVDGVNKVTQFYSSLFD